MSPHDHRYPALEEWNADYFRAGPAPRGIECYCLLHETEREALRTMPVLEDVGIAMHPRMLSCGIQTQERALSWAGYNSDSDDDVSLIQ
jgi:hypothetical protein